MPKQQFPKTKYGGLLEPWFDGGRFASGCWMCWVTPGKTQPGDSYVPVRFDDIDGGKQAILDWIAANPPQECPF